MLFVWLFLYGAVMLLAGHVSARFYWAQTVGLILYTAGLIGWALARKKGKLLGFKPLSAQAIKKHLYFLPYFALVLYQVACNGITLLSWLTVLEILAAAVLEEVVFRGFLLSALRKRGMILGVLVSSAVFALAHLINLETGVLHFVLSQSLCAFIMGIALSGLRLSCGSLIPGMVIHFLINVTAWDFDPAMNDPVFWACMAIYLFCGIRSISLKRKEISL